ncbi:hypothetical protein ACFLYP_00080 [Chloroflexota bacterium]
MKIRSLILNICLIISTVCLSAGYLFAGYWQIVPASLVLIIFWILTKKRSVFWSSSSILVAYVILAAIGITANLSLVLMISASTTALASWDLIQFNQSLFGNPLRKTNAPLEKNHLCSLALAASVGMALALISSFINLSFSFGVMILLVLMAMGCLIYCMQYIMKKNY